MSTQIAPHPHDRSSSSHARNEGIRTQSVRVELVVDLRAGHGFVSFAVILVGELAWEKRTGCLAGQLLRPLDTAQESAFLPGHGMNGGPERTDEVHSLHAHPVRHEDGHRVPEGSSDGGERNACVTARGLDDESSGLNRSPLVRAAQQVKGHPVLHAPGHVEVLTLGEDPTRSPPETVIDGEEWRVAYEAAQAVKAGR